MIRTLRSLVDPSELAEVVAAAYGCQVTECELVRSLVNDVYRVRSADRVRIVKLYRTGHRTVDDVAWELELADVLKGIVAAGVPLADGRLAGELIAAEGLRPFSMWEWAPGRKPVAPFDDRLYRQFGAATAWFHAAADEGGMRPRRSVEIGELLGQILEEVLARLEPADRAAVAGLVAVARERLSGLDLDRGICHGDVSLDNLHFHLVDKPAWRGAESVAEGWAEHNLDRLRAAAARLT